jgi:hypothetical protein
VSSAPDSKSSAGGLRTRVGRALYFVGAALVALAAWLFAPRESRGGTPITVCIVDTSASALRIRPNWKRDLPGALDARAERARERGSDFAVLTFGADVRRVFGPASPDEYLGRDHALVASDDAASPLARTLDVARDMALAPGRCDANVILFVDGTWTGEDPRPRIAELARSGVDIEIAELPPPELVDVAIERLDLPRSIETGAPLVARVDLRALGPLHADARQSIDIVLACSNAGGAFTRQRTIPLAPEVFVDVDLGAASPGRTLVRATARLAGGGVDPIPENDVASASVVSDGAISVAVAAPSGMRAALMRAIDPAAGTSSSGLALEPVEPSAIGRALTDVDVLVTAGIPLRELSREHLEPFLQRGGGWIAFAGEEWLERDEQGGVLELSAMTPAVDKGGARDVVLLVDGSGSMTGAPFDIVRATVLLLADRAPTRGRLDLRVFGATLGPAVRVRGEPSETRDAVRARLSQALPTSAPGGPTRMFDALDALAREGGSAARLVVLFSDGRDDSASDPVARARAVREDLARARIELRAISAGSAANVERLASLLPEGEGVIQADALDEAALADLFAREIARESWRAGHDLAVLAALRASSGSLADAILGAEAQNAPWPPIERYLRMRSAQDADPVWVSERGEPLLALRRVGRGVAATVAFTPIDDVAPRWVATGGALFGPLLRALGRRPHTSEPTVNKRDGKLVVEDLPIDAPAELDARIDVPARGIAPASSITVHLLPETAATDPRVVRSAPWPVELDEIAGGALLPVTLSAANDGSRWSTTLELGMGSEFRGGARSPHDLTAARASSDRNSRDANYSASHPAARNVLVLGLFCLCVGALLGGLGRALFPESGRRETRSQGLPGPGRQGDVRA